MRLLNRFGQLFVVAFLLLCFVVIFRHRNDPAPAIPFEQMKNLPSETSPNVSPALSGLDSFTNANGIFFRFSSVEKGESNLVMYAKLPKLPNGTKSQIVSGIIDRVTGSNVELRPREILTNFPLAASAERGRRAVQVLVGLPNDWAGFETNYYGSLDPREQELDSSKKVRARKTRAQRWCILTNLDSQLRMEIKPTQTKEWIGDKEGIGALEGYWTYRWSDDPLWRARKASSR
jgi:hypothetical protein